MKTKHSAHEMDLTTGNLFWKLPLFALPLAFTTVLQLLYSTVDLWTVSKFSADGSLSMSAVGSNAPLINLIVSVFTNLSAGTNVAISAEKGAGNRERASKILHTSIILSLIFGIVVGVFGFFFSEPMLNWMKTPASILPKATDYMKIYFVGLPFLMIYNYGSQALRALGDSRRPLFILFVSGAINVVFDIVFVKYLNLDVKGVAWATVMSQGVSAILTLLVLFLNKKGFIYLQLSKLRMDKQSLKEVLSIGVPAGLQSLAFCIPNVLIQSSLYDFNSVVIDGVTISQDEIVAGSSAAAQIENYVFAFQDAFAVALSSFVGQNYGAKKASNIKKLFWYDMIWEVFISLLFAIICMLCASPILSIFISESDPTSTTNSIVKDNAIAAGIQRMWMMIVPYALNGIMIACGDYLRGMKVSTPPAIITIIGVTGLRILFLLTLFRYVPYFHALMWLYAAYPMSWIFVDLLYIPVILILQPKALKKMEGETKIA